MKTPELFKLESRKHTVLSEGSIVSESIKCVQCGICTYNCPIGIDVRSHVWKELPMHNSQCLACGECVSRCPRGVLRFAEAAHATGRI